MPVSNCFVETQAAEAEREASGSLLHGGQRGIRKPEERRQAIGNGFVMRACILRTAGGRQGAKQIISAWAGAVPEQQPSRLQVLDSRDALEQPVAKNFILVSCVL